MYIRVINLGGIKQDFIKKGIEYYFERIRYFSNISLIIPQKKFNYSSKEEKLKKQLEFALRYIEQSYNIVLDERGKVYDSLSFADFFQKNLINKNKVNFFIGGDDGFHSELKKKADEVISLSSYTLNHELVNLVLAEVLFRTFSIIKNHPYHR